MTPNQAKKIAAEALKLHGWAFDRLTAKTVDFADLGRGNRLFVTVQGLRDINPDSHLDKPTRWAAVRNVCRAAGFSID